MSRYWYVLHINPEPWAIGPLNIVKKNRKYIPFVGRNQQLHDYKEAIKEPFEKGDLVPVWMDGKIRLTFFFWRNRAEYLTPEARRHRSHEADVSNLSKATEDGLQGILFGNDRDSRVTSGWMVDQGPDVKGRLVICIEPAPTTEEILQLLPAHVLAKLEEKPSPPAEADQWSKSNPGALF